MSGTGVQPLPQSDLRAVTRRVDLGDDLLEALGSAGFCWIEHGTGIATAGVAATVTAEDAVATLAAIPHDTVVEGSGIGPVAVGALPFDPTTPATLTIPARIVGRSADGTAWVTHIGPMLDAVPDPRPRPTRFTVEERQARAWWDDAVAAALEAIAAGPVEKVVLAREVAVEADVPFDVLTVLRRLRSQQPGCILYAHEGFVGATPELLVRRTGRAIESRPMAGTAPGSVPAEVAVALAASGKDSREHRYVVDAVRDALAEVTEHLAVPATPVVEHFGSLAHLVTPISGTLTTPLDALALARRLHPTPAVGGTPSDDAVALIARLEPFDRGRYAGPVGWVDARGDGAFAVALRGAELDGTTALLRAGAGIVAGSDADAEWAETAAKLEPMLRALIVP